MPSRKLAIKNPENTPAGKIRKHSDNISDLLFRLGIVDLKGRNDLYIDLRNYWLELRAIDERKEWNRIRGRR